MLAMADEQPKEGVKTENNDRINLKVAGQDGSVVQFKIKWHTLLSKLKEAYCEQQGLSRGGSDSDLTGSQSVKQTHMPSWKWKMQLIPAADPRYLLNREPATFLQGSVPPDREDILNQKTVLWFPHLLTTAVELCLHSFVFPFPTSLS